MARGPGITPHMPRTAEELQDIFDASMTRNVELHPSEMMEDHLMVALASLHDRLCLLEAVDNPGDSEQENNDG